MTQVITVNEDDTITGSMEKMEAHRRNILHRAFSVFCMNSGGEMLLQKRAENKYHSPGLWSNACCSHPLSDTFSENEVRERLRLEMGFDAPVEYLYTERYQADLGNGLYENEIDRIYYALYNGNPSPNTEEVSDFMWISIPKLDAMLIKEPEIFTMWFRILYPPFMESYRDKLQGTINFAQ